MGAVAAGAGRGVGGAELVAHPVDARGKLRGGFFMARGTLRGRQLGVVRRLLDRAMAIDAFQAAVDGLREDLGAQADPDGSLAPLARFEFRRMAVHALAVRHRRQFGTAHLSRDQCHHQHRRQAPFPPGPKPKERIHDEGPIMRLRPGARSAGVAR
jgi:hypothetical protein